ncbi:uncharacterized protein [Drosophila pseudoobscura]|uniref:Uncharacterized protein isoform X2 n=1 Tax=Drosophila pseudoobscura pseudoobscura TaxID=46245 RepID=A0A6I8W804_DROPS|nr:uncharacterized protein LOC6901567 isoform X2 [Drosophila pseudoobscura]
MCIYPVYVDTITVIAQIMGSAASRRLSAAEKAVIQAESGFSIFRIGYLFDIYESLRKKNGVVQKKDLMHCPPLAGHPLANAILDRRLNPSKGFRHFINTLEPFQRRTPVERKLLALLRLFDNNADDKLSSDECFDLLLRLPCTQREFRAMRRKLNRMLVEKAKECARKMVRQRAERQAERMVKEEAFKLVPEWDQKNKKKSKMKAQKMPQKQFEEEEDLISTWDQIHFEDLIYITRGMDLQDSLSLRFPQATEPTCPHAHWQWE